MKNTTLKLNTLKSSLLIGVFVFISFYYSSVTYAKEINSQNIIELINYSRLSDSLNPLAESSILSEVAQSKVSDMAKNHYFAHTSPAGVTPWHWFDKNNYSYKYAGENLAINYESAEEEHGAWMKSIAHKENILNSNFKEIGVATSKGIINGKKSNITVTVFGTPEENILATTKRSSVANKNSYILGVQSQSVKPLPLEKGSAYQLNISPKFTGSIKKQSHNIVWTVALIAILIVLKDIVLRTINAQTFQHRHSVVNLILFIMIYAIFF
ncbi:MAG: hypothetical protein ACD_7C00098G0006 [uncultured bacterium]|nr:MAG: hypothetical protein ACD_7C00098G0006 [uncultured bacterium]HBR78979.1 hypothetical protein [Candidatus Moranbacteria bacterium]